MSKQVDERVVSMQFDNRQFEKNVHTSMSTLEKLKQKLNLSGAAKGLDGLNSAAKKVDLSGLGNGVEAVRSKFSALEVMGVTALANITNSAVNAGKRIVSALTIDPVKTGFEEYETQINAIQTILANTQKEGTNVEQVNAALDELNHYADKTIYNFTEMTKNIGTFTAAGVDLKTSVSAIQGIANLAAVSGSTSIQASTAMYQLSQALAAGKVSLTDWNSVVTAGMGGQVFQDALVETSRLLKTGADEAIKANGTFRESLHDGWLTAEVMTETLKKFTTSGANEYAAEYTGLSKDAVEAAIKSAEAQYGEADAIEYASKALAKKSGKNAEEIKSVLNMARTAEDAATKVKTFSQLWDTLKEAVQSGWGQTWRLIVGDFDQAKELFTGLSDFFGGIINRMNDFRNNLLEGALSNPFTGFLDKLNASSIGKVADKVESVTMSLEKYQKVVNDVWRGDYKTSDTGRFEMLDKAGYNHKVVQDLVNKGYQYKLTVEDIEASEKKFGVSLSKTSEAAEGTAKKFENLSDEQLKNAGLTEDEIKMYRDLETQSKKTGKSIQELVDEMGKKDGRTLLLESFANAGKGLVAIIGAIKDAWLDVFPPPTVMQLYNVISALNAFSQKLKVSGETADKLKRTFKGLFSILHVISTVVGGVLNTTFKIAKQVLWAFNLDILDVTASIGDALVKFDEWFSSIFDFTELIKKAVPYITDMANSIREWFGGIKDADNIPKYIIEGLVNGLITGVKAVGNAALSLGKVILEKIKNFLGIHSPSTEFIEIGKNCISGFVIGIQNGVSFIWETLKGIVSKGSEILKNIDWGTVIAGVLSASLVYSIVKFAKAIDKLASPIEGIGDVLTGFGEALGGLGKYFKSLSFSIKLKAVKDLALAITVLVAAVIALTFIEPSKLWTAVGVLGAIVGILAGLVVVVIGLSKLSNAMDVGSIKFGAISLGLMGISASLLILAQVIKQIGSLNLGQAIQGFLGMVGMIGALIILMSAYGKLVKGKAAQNTDKLGSMMLKFSIALLILIGVIKLVSNMGTREILKGLAVIFVLELFAEALIAVSAIAGKSSSKVGSMLLKMAVALMIMTTVMKLIAGMSWDEIGKGVTGLGAFLVFITLLVFITRLGGKEVPKLGGMLLAMAVAMLILTGIIKLIANMKWLELGKGLAGIVVFGLIVSGLLAVAAKAQGTSKLAATLLAMSIAIGILSVIAVLLGMVDIENLVKGTLAVVALSAIMALLTASTKNAASSIGTIVALIASIAVLTTALIALSFVNSDKLLASALSLAAVMAAFALMTVAAGSLKNTDKLVSKLLPLVGVVAILAIILGVMDALNVESSIQTAGSLAILLASMAAAMFILGNTKSVINKTIGTLALMGLVVSELAIILGVMNALEVEAAIPTAVALGLLLNAMAAAMLILSLAKGASAASIGTLACMGLVVGELAVILGLMAHFNVEPSIETAVALSTLLLAMSAALVILGAVGAKRKAAFIGIGALATLIAGIGGLIVGIGALVTHFPQLEKFLDTGIPMISKIGTAIGEFFGNIVGGFLGSAVSSGLPVIAKNLSAFMDELQPFISGAKEIDSKVVDGVKSIAETILILTAANILDGIALLVPGTSSIAKFGFELSLLGYSLSDFAKNLGTFGEEQVTSINCAASAIKAMANAANEIPNEGGLLSAIVGDNGLDKFGKKLPFLGTNLRLFADNLGTFGDDQIQSIECASDAIVTMAQAADKIPNEGGWLSVIVGDNGLDKFGKKLPVLGTKLRLFADNLGTFGDDQIQSIECAADAIVTMSKAADKIPNEGGWASVILGDNSIVSFGNALPDLGWRLAEFINQLGPFGEEQVDIVACAANAIVAMAQAADQIPNEGGWLEAIVGDNTISSFGAKLPGVGMNLSNFASNLGTFGEDQVNTIACAASAIVEMSKASKEIDGQAGWAKVLFGDNSISTFSAQLPVFGKNLRTFVDNLGVFGEGQISTTNSSVTAINALATLANSDIKGAKKNLEGFGDKIVKLAKDLASFVSEMPATSSLDTAISNVKKILQMIKDISGADANVLKNFTKSLGDIGKKGVEAFVNAFTSDAAKSDVKQAAIDLISEVIDGFESKIKDVEKSSKKVTDAGKDAIRNKRGAFYNAGAYLVEGFAAGISENDYKAEAKARAMARAAVAAAQAALGEHSPSKVFNEIGDYAGQGFINGLSDYEQKSYKASAEVANYARRGLGDSIRKIKDLIESDVDTQPTIRPVLDLSNVQSGMDAVSGLFDTRANVDLVTNVGSISSRMNRNIQNGKNSDIVSAIDKLGKNIGKSSSDTYNINGITYDDGSNVSNAVRELVRAARVERRK